MIELLFKKTNYLKTEAKKSSPSESWCNSSLSWYFFSWNMGLYSNSKDNTWWITYVFLVLVLVIVLNPSNRLLLLLMITPCLLSHPIIHFQQDSSFYIGEDRCFECCSCAVWYLVLVSISFLLGICFSFPVIDFILSIYIIFIYIYIYIYIYI